MCDDKRKSEERLEHLSPSQLNTLSMCGLRWYFRYVERIKIPPKAAVLRGRGAHAAREKSLGNYIDTGELLPLGSCEAAASDEVDAGFQGDVLFEPEEVEEGVEKVKGRTKDEAVACAKVDRTDVQPTIEPVAVEMELRTHIPAIGKDLMGYADVVEKRMDEELERPVVSTIIRDSKTKGKAPSKDEAWSSLQLTCYGLMWKGMTGAFPNNFALDFLVVYKKAKPKAFIQPTERSLADYKMALARIARANEVIEKGVFAPAPTDAWWCSPKWCGYWDRCEFGGRGRTKPGS